MIQSASVAMGTVQANSTSQADQLDGSRKRRLRIGIATGAMLLPLAWCLWLLGPSLWTQFCANRVASFYQVTWDTNSGNTTGIELRTKIDVRALQRWEEHSNEPMHRLLPLLQSDDDIHVQVVAQAIEAQLQRGRLVGWPGRYERVDPIDASRAGMILAALSTWRGSLSSERVAQIIAAMRDGADPRVMATFFYTLRRGAPDDPETESLAIEFLEHDSYDVRNSSVQTLYQLKGELPPEVLPRLLAGVRSGRLVDSAALHVIDPGVLPLLIRRLS